MFLTFDSDQPAKSSAGMDTTGQQTVPAPEPPHGILTPAPRPHAPQSTDLNLDRAPPREQRIRRPPSNMTLRQAPEHKELT